MKTLAFTHHFIFGLILSPFLLIGSALLFTSLQAQDQASNKPADVTKALTPSSSAGDVEALADKIAKNIAAATSNDTSNDLSSAVLPYVGEFSAVDHKVLISISSKFDPKSSIRDVGIKGTLLLNAVTQYSTPDDIPELFASNCKWLVHSFGRLTADPAGAPILFRLLQTTFPSDLTFFWPICRSSDPKVQQALATFLSQLPTNPKVPNSFLCKLFSICYDVGTPTTNKGMADIAVALLSRDDPAAYQFLIDQANEKLHGRRTKTVFPLLTQAINDYFASNPKVSISPQNLIIPGLFGNSDALAKAIQLYSRSTDQAIKSKLKTDLFDHINYTGSGNKLDDLRDHCKDATYQNGDWTLTTTAPPANIRVESVKSSQPAATKKSSGNWPQWYGPNRDNISTETGLLSSWPPEGPPLAWKATCLGAGASTVVIANGKVFATGMLPDATYVQALDLKDGKSLWKAKIDGGGAPNGDSPGAHSTPSVEGDCVYALSPGGNLVCVQAADGKEVWRKHMKNDFHVGKAYPGFGYSESVLVAGDKLFCIPGGPDGAVMALNKMTGELVWRTKDLTDTSCYCSLVMANIGAVPQLLACTASHLSGIAPDSGKILWSVDKSSPTQVVPTPIWKDDCVFTSDGAVGCNLVKITHSGADFKAEQVYANKKSVLARLAGGVLVGQDIYGCVDGWTCMDFLTGKVIWSDKQKLGGGTLTYAEGHLYLRTGGKGPCTLALIEASPSGWKETGRFEQPDRSAKAPFAHLVISNGKLFVRDQDILLCYDIKQK